MSPNSILCSFIWLQITIDDIIKTKINKKHLKNYFKYLFIKAHNYIETH